jgi:hypothetical protein
LLARDEIEIWRANLENAPKMNGVFKVYEKSTI